MNRLEVFCFYRVVGYAGQARDASRHIAHEVFNKFGVVVRPFGNVFFVGALEQTPKLTRTFLFYGAYKVVNAKVGGLVQADSHRYMRTLVMGPVVGN